MFLAVVSVIVFYSLERKIKNRFPVVFKNSATVVGFGLMFFSGPINYLLISAYGLYIGENMFTSVKLIFLSLTLMFFGVVSFAIGYKWFGHRKR